MAHVVTPPNNTYIICLFEWRSSSFKKKNAITQPTKKKDKTNLPVVACWYSSHLAQSLTLLPRILGYLAHGILRLKARLVLDRSGIFIQRIERTVNAARRGNGRRISSGGRCGSLRSGRSLGRTQSSGNIQRRLGRTDLTRLSG